MGKSKDVQNEKKDFNGENTENSDKSQVEKGEDKGGAEKQDDVEYPYEFDEEKRKKAELYFKQQLYVGLIAGTLLIMVTLAVLYFSSAAVSLQDIIFDVISNTFIDNYWAGAALFVTSFLALIFVIGIPIRYYSGYVLEHSYDLSKQSLLGWVKDIVKEFMLFILLGTLLISGLFYLAVRFPEMWWVYAGVLYFLVMGVFVNFFNLIRYKISLRRRKWNTKRCGAVQAITRSS
ncbi:MAG: hypothetical protein V5A88_07145 [Candidatus Thermoplasmatota archaeon]